MWWKYLSANVRAKILFTALALGTLVLYVGWWYAPALRTWDHKYYDRLNELTTHPPKTQATVIVAIDEKSLTTFGQWPWPRILSAELFRTVAQAHPAAIVSDIAFVEPDRTSPTVMRDFYRTYFDQNASITDLSRELYDHDRILGETIAAHRIVLPVFSVSSDIRTPSCELPESAINYRSNIPESLLNLSGLKCNLSPLQNRSGGIGHIHVSAEEDGYLRRIPLILNYNGQLLPTLSIAGIHSLNDDLYLSKTGLFDHDLALQIAGHTIITDEHAQALIRFYPQSWYTVVSASDILSGKIDPEILRGKFVFVGATALGLDTWYLTPDKTLRSGVYVHAAVAENLFNDDLVSAPSLYPVLNLTASCITALILLVLIIQKRFLIVITVFIAVSLVSFGTNLYGMHHNTFLSGGYYFFPLLFYIFLMALSMFYVDYRNKQRFFRVMHRSNRIRKKLKSDLDLSQSQIEHQKIMMFQQSKMAAMGEMIGNIAHQWRQPLNILALNVQNVEHSYAFGEVDDAFISRFTEDSMNQILYMSQTIDDFRNFLNPAQDAAPFTVKKAIDDTFKLVQSTLTWNKIEYAFTCDDDTAQVLGSVNEFKQIIINLINNTKDALAEKNRSDGTITIEIESDSERVRIRFRDNAGGIPPQIIERIFEPYYTTKPEGKGTGIGLYMSYQIIHAKMGGSIGVKNVDGGAEFIIDLPRE